MKVPENVKTVLESALKTRRIAVATATKSGIPNVAPLGYLFFLNDETLILVDNFFLKTRKNMDENPMVAVSFWQMEEKDGVLKVTDAYQVKGKVMIEESGPLYEKIKAEVKSRRPEHPVKAIVLMKVEEIYTSKPGPDAGKRIV